MTDRPILMTGASVRGILREIEQPGSGKTQTRRLAWREAKARSPVGDGVDVTVPTVWQKVRPGDRLWVRESFWGCDFAETGDLPIVVYDERHHGKSYDHPGNVMIAAKRFGRIPSIHMTRKASRLTLIVTAARMERLQEISEADAIAEGMIWSPVTEDDLQWARDNDYEMTADDGVWLSPGTRQGYGPRRNDPQWAPTAASAYRFTWGALHAKPGRRWEDNPELVPITFVPHLANIGAMTEAA